MIIIEKIEISYFRSFGEKAVKICDLKDLNIFSGANDVGKSNVLKALNLFFNNQINMWESFDLEKDLSFLQKERSIKNLEKKKSQKADSDSYASQRDLFVKIKIFFIRSKTVTTSTSPDKFWVAKKWYRNGRSTREDNLELAYKIKNGVDPTARQSSALKGQLKQFLDSINFEYIPAVKDREFFKHLFSKLQKSVLDRDDKFKKYSDEINKNIKDITIDLFKEFKDRTNIQAQFEIPESLISFFSTIGVSTENDISLFARGDGMQARFIPAILNEISKGKKNVIWGFEEPENSYEYKHAEDLSQDFLNKYCKNKQIFITSHTKEFLSLIKNNEDKVSLHRVYKTVNNGSLIGTYKKGSFDKDNIQRSFWENVPEKDKTNENQSILNKIFDDIGFLETDQYLVESLQNQLKEQRNILNQSGLSLRDKDKIISNLNKRIRKHILDKDSLKNEIDKYKKPQVFVEDTYMEIYKISWLKLNNKPFNEKNLNEVFESECYFKFYNKDGSKNLNKFLNEVKIDEKTDQKIIGIFDFDEAFIKDFISLDNKYRWSEIKGTEDSCLYKKRLDHDCFYAVTIPVPNSKKDYANQNHKNHYLTTEHLFEDDFLNSIGCHDGYEIINSGLKTTKIKKNKLRKKLIYQDPKHFQNFKPLFQTIETLIKSSQIEVS